MPSPTSRRLRLRWSRPIAPTRPTSPHAPLWKIKSKPRTRGARRCRPRCSPRSPSGGACASGTKGPRRRRRRERDGASGRGRRQRSCVARHVDTLTDVRKQKAEKRALQGQLDRTRLVLGRTRHKLTATLNHPPAMHKASGVTKERRRRRRPVEEQPSVRRRADEEPSWRSSATAPSRHPLAAESSVLTVPSTYAPAPAPAPA